MIRDLDDFCCGVAASAAKIVDRCTECGSLRGELPPQRQWSTAISIAAAIGPIRTQARVECG